MEVQSGPCRGHRGVKEGATGSRGVTRRGGLELRQSGSPALRKGALRQGVEVQLQSEVPQAFDQALNAVDRGLDGRLLTVIGLLQGLARLVDAADDAQKPVPFDVIGPAKVGLGLGHGAFGRGHGLLPVLQGVDLPLDCRAHGVQGLELVLALAGQGRQFVALGAEEFDLQFRALGGALLGDLARPGDVVGFLFGLGPTLGRAITQHLGQDGEAGDRDADGAGHACNSAAKPAHAGHARSRTRSRETRTDAADHGPGRSADRPADLAKNSARGRHLAARLTAVPELLDPLQGA